MLSLLYDEQIEYIIAFSVWSDYSNDTRFPFQRAWFMANASRAMVLSCMSSISLFAAFKSLRLQALYPIA